jgi:hypothetical protein
MRFQSERAFDANLIDQVAGYSVQKQFGSSLSGMGRCEAVTMHSLLDPRFDLACGRAADRRPDACPLTLLPMTSPFDAWAIPPKSK